MLKGNYLCAVFSHQQASYQLLYLFTENGPMSKKAWEELKMEMVDLKFKNLNRLNEFVVKMAEKLKVSGAFVFSPREFNQVVENMEEGEDFLDKLIEYGRPIEMDQSLKKSKFWDNF